MDNEELLKILKFEWFAMRACGSKVSYYQFLRSRGFTAKELRKYGIKKDQGAPHSLSCNTPS